MAYRWTRAWPRERESFHLIRSHGLNATQCPPLPLTWAIKSVSHTHSYVASQMLLKSTNPHLNKERTSFVVFNLQKIRHMNLLKGHARKNSQQRNLVDRHSLSSHMRKGWMDTTQQVDRSFSVTLTHLLPDMSSLYLPLLIFWTPVVNKQLPESIWPQEHDQHAPVRGTHVCSHVDISGLKTWFSCISDEVTLSYHIMCCFGI